MKKNWFKVLGTRSFIIICIGRLFHKILVSLDYYTVHIPIRNEVLELLNNNFKASSKNRLIRISAENRNSKYALRPQTSDKSVFYQVIKDEEYAPMMDIINYHNAQSSIMTIIDAGANIGLTSLYFKQQYANATIVAIEPDYENYKHLCTNIKLNNYTEKIIPVQKALWKNDNAMLSISSDFRDGQAWAKSVSENVTEQNNISTITLSQIAKNYFNEGTIDILKIDIEGTENVLFRDNDFIISLRERVRFMSLEIHDELECRELINRILKENGFSIQNIRETTFCVNSFLVN